MILAGDVGGTSTRLAYFEAEGAGLRALEGARYRSHDFPGLDAIVAAFLASHPRKIDGACFGIAGPVREGIVETPNIPWTVEARSLAALLALPAVTLLNDLEANAWGVFTLAEGDVRTLSAGTPDPNGNAAIIAAGTGLGEAGYHRHGERLTPFASEGGHADFAPRDETTIALFRWLAERFGHVSWERVVSGPGLANIYAFLRESRGGGPSVTEGADDAAAAISQAALYGIDALAVQALDLFVSLYGAEAGNLALKMKATFGLWIGGGIAPRILPRLEQPGFLEAFRDKGRFQPFMEAIPVRLILNDRTALRGAAWHALSSSR